MRIFSTTTNQLHRLYDYEFVAAQKTAQLSRQKTTKQRTLSLLAFARAGKKRCRQRASL